MTRKNFPLIVLVVLISSVAFGQQLPQYSQYMQNMYVLNPAASSLYKDVDINLGFRQQWAGFDGAPRTYYASGTVNLGKKPGESYSLYSIPISHRSLLKTTDSKRYAKHVVGGMIANDEYGAFTKSSVMASYAYHHPIGDSYYIAVGTSMGWYGLNFNSGSVLLENPTDNVYNDFIANGTRSNLFDINLGAYLYGERLFAGYSIYQLGQNEINLGNERTPNDLSDAKLKIHQFATVGYRFTINENLDLTPSVMLKAMNPAPVSMDFNLKATIYQRFWAGVSYRNQAAVSILAGLEIVDWLGLGYAYDYVTSDINDFSSGSHEIVLSVQFNRKK